MSNCSMISSMVAPASRFSKTADTGMRVSRNTHAPLNLPGTLSTAEHWDQSRVAMFRPPLLLTFYHGLRVGSRGGRRFSSTGRLQILRFAPDDNSVGLISGVICRGPQGLKPASLSALGGTAEAVPFPFVEWEASQRSLSAARLLCG